MTDHPASAVLPKAAQKEGAMHYPHSIDARVGSAAGGRAEADLRRGRRHVTFPQPSYST
jgi:hypothetical protein